MKTMVADSALWLWLNRPGIGGKRLRNWPSEVILGVAKTCKALDSQTVAPRTYTLEDMRTAYRAGHLNTWASGDGPGVDSQEWTQERDEALARI